VTASEYKALREKVGTQAEVSARLQVSRVTVAKRETGAMVITEEAARALSALAGMGGAGGRKRVNPKRRKANDPK
jgi:DNA-binding transcriptional regulator YiaG